MSERIQVKPYDGPVGGWGSVGSLAHHLQHEAAPGALAELPRQNKRGGFACTSCAWAKPAEPHAAEFCENGAKATFAELTTRRVTAGFFARHSLAELRSWSAHDLEHQGRLTEPMCYDPATDRYRPAGWAEAYAAIGEALRLLRDDHGPDATVFYASGRASLETSYLWQLFARRYGTNNLPDSSNMCHESTSVGLKQTLGVPVGTVLLDDFEHCDGVLFFGQNVGSNSPRMLHLLQGLRERGAPIIVFNPLRERGLEAFTNPQRPGQMLLGPPTAIASGYHTVRPGGDIAAMAGMAKVLLETDEASRARGGPPVLDHAFITEHCDGFEAFADWVRTQDWDALERESGLEREALREAALAYANCSAVIGVYGMGLTQHRLGVDNVRMLVNLLLLRGHIGRRGAGVCPVRGHSNVQGQRTVGISEKPELVPLDRLAELYRFEPPRHKGFNTVEACEAVIDGRVKAFLGLGGNFVQAVPDTGRIEAAWPALSLTVHVATKLNRSHLLPGREGWLLPCLGRLERDEQPGGPQCVTVEDSTTCIHASHGRHPPADARLQSETRIVAELALATLGPDPHLPWRDWAAHYGFIRNAIEATWPDQFKDFNARLDQPGGFPRPLAARERVWNTDSGKAGFHVPPALSAAFEGDGGDDVLRLVTLRSNDQFNTTVYGFDDRLRGISGGREVLLMNARELARRGLADGDRVTLASAAGDGRVRERAGLRATVYELPDGCCAGYYPECNVVVPLAHHAEQSHVPAVKSVPVRVRPAAAA
jgi:molybdopterin-dependent oxidoreductase alpha subunit